MKKLFIIFSLGMVSTMSVYGSNNCTLPPGSYSHSCVACSYNNQTLTCSCSGADGAEASVLSKVTCETTVSNCNGVLTAGGC